MEERINGLLGLLRSLKLWQMGLLAIVVVGSAGTTYGLYANTTIDGASLGENQQLIPASYGDLVNQVSTNGSLTFPEKEGLRFDAVGTVAEVLVKEGQHVTQGQVLARLDESAVAELEEAAASARVALRDAQTALSDLTLEHSVQLASAEEAVASAELALQDADKALEDAREPYTSQQIKAQEQAVAAARLSLKNAQEALIDLEPDFSLQLAAALRAHREAETALKDVRQARSKFEDDHSAELVAATQSKADAQIALNEAKVALEDYEGSRGARLSDSRVKKDDAEEAVAETQAQIDRLMDAQQSTSGDLSSRIRFLRGILEIQEEFLADLQANVAEVDRLEAAVEVAELNLKAARDDLAELTLGPDSLARRDLEAAEQVAEADVKVTDRALASLLAGLDPLEVEVKQSDLALAEAALEQAEEDLAEILAGPDPAEVALRERQVALAQANLDQARADRAALETEPDPLELAVRQARVASAQRDLNDAMQRVVDSTLRSPIDGLVTQVNVEEGDEIEASGTTGGSGISPSSVIVEVVDTSIVEIAGIVDEIDVLLVEEGVPVQVTLDALPGQVLEGVISEISPAAEVQQGVVTYPISIQVEVPDGLRLREGLTAAANIVLNEERDVLLVPQQALYGSFDQPVVRVMTAGGIEERRVSLGNTDDFWVAVREGLQEGEQVVMESAEVNTTGSGFGQIRRITVGGRGWGR